MTRKSLATVILFLAVTTGFLVGRASADQPHMQLALDSLRSAKVELEKAAADKGGHRAAAIRLVNDAITEVERGINFDRRH